MVVSASLAASEFTTRPARSTLAVSRCRTALVAVCLALVVPARAQAAGKVAIVDGADDPVQVTAGEKKDRFFRVAPGEGQLVVTAEGPVVLSVRIRALKPRRATGTLRIVRDDGPFSDTPYDLERDSGASVEVSAAAEENAATAERVLHVQVPDGEHRFALSAVKGPALLVKILKTARFDPKLAVAPERNTAAVVRKPADERPRETEREPAAPRRAEAPAARVESDPNLPVFPSNRVTGIERAPATRASNTESPPVGLDERPPTPVAAAPTGSLADLAERAAPTAPKQREGGFANALHVGGLVFSGFPDGAKPAANASLLDGRVFTLPSSLELAWDLDRNWSLFLDGGYYQATRQQTHENKQDPDFQQLTSRTRLRVAPGAFGVTAFIPTGARFGLRLRAGGVLGWVQSQTALAAQGAPLVDQPARQSLGFGAVGGLSFEAKAGPGRIGLEARYLLLRTDLGLRSTYPAQPYNAAFGDVGGLQLLAGYRLEL